jgi:hypothetical protein
MHVKWLYVYENAKLILSCELNPLHAHFCSLGNILLNLCLGIMLFSFGVKDPVVIMNV